MAAALLAKLKINKPPALKQELEINIKERAEAPVPAAPVPVPVPAAAAPAPAAAASAQSLKKNLAVRVVDESKKTNFDRDTFLKTFKKPKVINTQIINIQEPVAAPAPAPAPALAPVPEKKTKKNTTRKLKIIKPSLKINEPAQAPVAQAAPALEEEEVAEPATELKIQRRRTKKPIVGVKEGPLGMLTIGDADIDTRLKKKREAPLLIPASSYYMNNREIFVNFMSSLFNKYKKNLADEAAAPATCPGDTEGDTGFSLMTHQQIVRDYLNLYTPYRGLLLYHGLGSGKTCSSIAIAEGMKTVKPVIIMTPASLQVNYREELKKCGDELYKKNQYWEFIHTKGKEQELIDTLSSVLSVSVEYINKQGGAWMVNMSKASNYDQLSPSDKLKLDQQIEQMIMYKYKFINYNGLRATKVVEMTKGNTINPFDNSVVIVDEAHNLVSRIVNKIGKKQGTIALTLYSLLMRAKNVKIILLSGTPIINFPNEIAILFNMLRGLITTWSFKLTISEERQINTAYFQSIFKSTILGGNIVDLIDYRPSSTTLVITRNPFGFVNKQKSSKTGQGDGTLEYAGVKLEVGERGELSDDVFIELVTKILNKNNIKIQPNGISVQDHKALPDSLEEFKSYFIDDTGEIKNENLFKRRILGLSSYFRSAQESLMPRYVKSNPADFQIIKIPMSDFQLGVYEEARVQERELDKRNAKKRKIKKPGVEDLYEKTTSTYRIFSRLFCNFVFPSPAIKRPMPDKKKATGEETSLAEAITTEQLDEDSVDDVSKEERLNRDESFEETAADEEGADVTTAAATIVATERSTYKDRIQRALEDLKKESGKYLTPEALQVYSPKFLHILENIQDESHKGIHLMYSQFRSLEGIGIFKLVLEANGFTQFKIKKVGATWELAIPEEDAGKPTFALYTGMETAEEKEIIRNVLNNAWKYVPDTITKKLKAIAPNNNLGEIIKLLMITSSGAEGISLKNVRYVHITEPYWHPVRIEQVIGRARRICSHQALPEELRTVTVLLYIMTFSDAQMKSDNTIELRTNDKSRKDDITPVSTDESLYEIASAKEEITTHILKSVKEASIDCALHLKSNKSENLQCFTFGSSGSSKFSYQPSYSEEQSDVIADRNKKEVTWKAKQVELDGIKYALNPKTNEVYDLDSYVSGRPVKVATLTINKGKGKDTAATYKLEFI